MTQKIFKQFFSIFFSFVFLFSQSGFVLAPNSAEAGIVNFIRQDAGGCSEVANLIAHWKFDETSGSTADDVCGTYDGTTTGATVNQTGIDTKAYSFDGSGDYVSVSSLSNNEGTVSFWVKPNSTSEQWILTQSNSGATSFLSFQIHSSKFRIEQNGTNRFTIGDNIGTGQWYHVAWTSDGSTWKGYINGLEVPMTTVSGSNSGAWFADVSSPNGLYISSLNGSSQFVNGVVDDVRIYDTDLTASQISDVYSAISDVYLSDSLVAHWKFDETSGSSAADSAGSHTGTLTGPTVNQTGINGKAYSFDGGDYVSVPDSEDWNFGSGNFSYSYWVKPTAINSSLETYVISQFASGNGPFTYTGYYSTSYTRVLGYNGGTITNASTSNFTPKLNEWNHIVVSVGGAVAKVYRNGIEVASSSRSGSFANMSQSLHIGDEPNYGSAGGVQGLMDDVRVYDIPLSTSQVRSLCNEFTTCYAPPTDASVLIAENGSDASQTFVDAGSKSPKKTLVALGNGQHDTSYKYTGSSSMISDGSGDGVNISQSSDQDFAFGTGDFTIETWFRTTSSNTQGLWGWRPASTGDGGNWIYAYLNYCSGCSVNTNGGMYLNIGKDNSNSVQINVSAGTLTVTDGAWHHVALVRESNTLKLYYDGTQVGNTPTASFSIPCCSTGYNPNVIYTGTLNGSSYSVNGHMDDFSITKGTARYTSNFTP